jgi:hypothetical protein
VRRPLSAAQVAELEAEIGMPAPPGVRAWLMSVGLYQDLTDDEDFDFIITNRAGELVEDRQALVAMLGPEKAAGLFPFADDGAGNTFAVRGDDLLFVDDETGEVSRLGGFDEWMQRVVTAAAAHSATVHKQWCVQFTFKTASVDSIFDAIRTAAVLEVDPVWSTTTKSPSGVQSASRAIRINGRLLTIIRSEYKAWTSPLFSFDWQEPAMTAPDDSLIAKLDAAFKARKELGYKLVDYGPLDLDREDAADQAPPTGIAGFFRRLGAMFRS